MNVTHLLIVPGLSSPFAEAYRPCYALLKREAAIRGIQYCEVLLLPGQMDGSGAIAGRLSLRSAATTLNTRLRELEKTGRKYRLLGFSFGATVSLAAAVESRNLDGLEKVVLYGPIPFWLSWQNFVTQLDRSNLAKDTMLIPDLDYFRELVPVEHLLGLVRHPVLVAAGSDDTYCPPHYLDYLEQVAHAANQTEIAFARVERCAHNVKEGLDCNWQQYIATVLG